MQNDSTSASTIVIIVDTNAWIELLRAKGEAGVKLAMSHLVKAGEAYLCGPVAMELIAGVRPEQGRRLTRNLDVYPMATDPPDLWVETGRNYARLRAAGLTVPRADVLIATVSLFHDCRLYSADSHFPKIAPILGLKLYTPGPGGTFVPESS